MTEAFVAPIAAGVVLALVFAGGRWLRRMMRRDHEAAVLRVVEPRLAEIRAELRPNGGTSAFDRLDKRLVNIDTHVSGLTRMLVKHIDDHDRNEDP